jgi:hypothetical protein
MHPESDYGRMIGGSFRECLGGFAACGLLRKKLPPIIRPLPTKANSMGLIASVSAIWVCSGFHVALL